jgi:hypothetical protein
VSAGEHDDAIRTADEAITGARAAIEGKIEPGPGAAVTAVRRGDRWIVEWAFPPQPRRGPDFEARVELDARSGEVLSILAGS